MAIFNALENDYVSDKEFNVGDKNETIVKLMDSDKILYVKNMLKTLKNDIQNIDDVDVKKNCKKQRKILKKEYKEILGESTVETIVSNKWGHDKPVDLVVSDMALEYATTDKNAYNVAKINSLTGIHEQSEPKEYVEEFEELLVVYTKTQNLMNRVSNVLYEQEEDEEDYYDDYYDYDYYDDKYYYDDDRYDDYGNYDDENEDYLFDLKVEVVD